MNPILSEIYSTVIPSAPFVIAAYAFIWVVLLVWVFLVFRKQERLKARLDVIEETLREQQEN